MTNTELQDFFNLKTTAITAVTTTSTDAEITTYVNAIFQAVLGRDPAATGLANISAAIKAGTFSETEFANVALTANVNDAKFDYLTADEKTAAATSQTAAKSAFATDFTAKAVSLTTGVDALTGSLTGDTFTASVLTANDGDTITDASTTDSDTLNLETAANITENFKTTSIETVNLNALGAVSVDAKNMTGLNTFNSNDAAGAITITNIADASTTFGIKGSATNSMDISYVTGALNGAADTLAVAINGSSATTITADTGFEAVTLDVTAKSDLATITATGATALTISGAGALTVADSTIDAFTDYTITSSAVTTLGSIATVKSLDATTNTAGIVQATNATATLNNGTSNDAITMHSAGGIVQTGSGDDIINVNSASVYSTNSTIVKLGAGNDNLNLSAVSSAGEYIYAEAGDDTIYVGASLTSADLIDAGTGTDTVNFSSNIHSLIAKGIENVNVEGAATVNFVTTDTVTTITDSGAAAVTFGNLLNGSTYTSTLAKTALTTLGFKTSEAATVNANFTKGTTGGLTTTEAAIVTATYGATSTLAAPITLDEDATSLTINATGALLGGQAIAGGALATEKLATVAITGDKDVTMGAITNDASITSVSVSSTGGSSTIGTVGAAANTTADVTVSKIEVTSSLHEAVIGHIDFSGVATTVSGNIAAITATGVDGATATTIGNINADTIGTITATSTKNAVTVATGGNVTVGADTTDTTDGVITAIKVSGFLGASIADTGTINVDRIDSIIVESTDTTTGGLAELGAIDDANAGGTPGAATLGTINVTSAKAAAETNAILADAMGNFVVSAGTTATVAAIDVSNAANDSVANNFTVTAGTNALVDLITTDVIGNITVKATAGTIGVKSFTAADATGMTVSLTATGAIEGTGGDATITNSKGDLDITITTASTLGAGNSIDASAGAAATTDVDLVYNASAVAGILGGGGTTLVTNVSQDDTASSTIVKGGAAANTFTISADGGTVAYYGQDLVDTIILTAGKSYATSTINAEAGDDVITTGDGIDTINAGLGIDTITSGKGADTINLAETTLSIDIISTLNSDVTVDVINGFTEGNAGASGDELKLSEAFMELSTAVTDHVLIGDATSTATGAAASVVTTLAANTTLDLDTVSTTTILSLGATFADLTAVEAALVTGGTNELTVNNAWGAKDAGTVIWTDGTNTHVSLIISDAVINDGGKFVDANTTMQDLVVLNGTTIGSFTLDNFDTIA